MAWQSAGLRCSRTWGCPHGQLQGLADQGQRDVRLHGQLAANQAAGNGRGNVDRAGLPMGQPGPLGLVDLVHGLPQGGHGGAKLLLDHLLDRRQGGLPAFLLRLLADGPRLLPGPLDDPARLGPHPILQLPGLRRNVLEVEGHLAGAQVLIGGAKDGRHGGGI